MLTRLKTKSVNLTTCIKKTLLAFSKTTLGAGLERDKPLPSDSWTCEIDSECKESYRMCSVFSFFCQDLKTTWQVYTTSLLSHALVVQEKLEQGRHESTRFRLCRYIHLYTLIIHLLLGALANPSQTDVR